MRVVNLSDGWHCQLCGKRSVSGVTPTFRYEDGETTEIDLCSDCRNKIREGCGLCGGELEKTQNGNYQDVCCKKCGHKSIQDLEGNNILPNWVINKVFEKEKLREELNKAAKNKI